MAFFGARPGRKPETDRPVSGIDSRLSGGSRDDLFKSPAFREHLQKNHHGLNPFERDESTLERAAKESVNTFEREEDFQKSAAKNEKVIMYGSNDQKGGALYGTKDSEPSSNLYGSGHANSGGEHITCCNLDFMKDGSVQAHQESQTQSYAAGPGAAPTGYGGRAAGSASSLYKK